MKFKKEVHTCAMPLTEQTEPQVPKHFGTFAVVMWKECGKKRSVRGRKGGRDRGKRVRKREEIELVCVCVFK